MKCTDGAWVQPQLFLPTHPSRIVGSEGLWAREPREELRQCPSTPSTAGSQPREQTETSRRAQGALGDAPKCVNKNCSREGRGGKHRLRLSYYLNASTWISLAVSLHSLKQSLVLGERLEQPLLVCRDWYHKVVNGLRHDCLTLSCLKFATSAKDIQISPDSAALTEFSLSSLVLSSERQPWCWWQLPRAARIESLQVS